MENETIITDGILERGSVDADGNAVIADGVTDIGNEAFLNCTSLVSATIPEGVRSIGGSAFEGCASLRSLSLPKSLQSIDEDALLDCPQLSEITYAGTVSEWEKVCTDECMGDSLHFNAGLLRIYNTELTADLPEIPVHCTDGDSELRL